MPALVWIFTAYDFSPEVITHLAIGTSLATIVVTSISSLTAHNKRGGVRWEVWRKMALGLVIGSLVGAGIADMIDGQALQAIIGFGALLVFQVTHRAKDTAIFFCCFHTNNVSWFTFFTTKMCSNYNTPSPLNNNCPPAKINNTPNARLSIKAGNT